MSPSVYGWKCDPAYHCFWWLSLLAFIFVYSEETSCEEMKGYSYVIKKWVGIWFELFLKEIVEYAEEVTNNYINYYRPLSEVTIITVTIMDITNSWILGVAFLLF